MTSAGKRAAGIAAAELVEDGMQLGYGTGSTVEHFLVALAQRALDVSGVPTSRATEERCGELGLALVDLASTTHLDLVVDGADELTEELVLTKGGGGALLREKVVAGLGERFVVIATPDKVVPLLGATFALPVEVVEFALPVVLRSLHELGATTSVRGGGGYRTDNGNPIVDATFRGGIEDPEVLAAQLSLLSGVVEHGLFTGMATSAILGAPDGFVRRLEATSGT
jgi:ribose 5-phosphate isomerase A